MFSVRHTINRHGDDATEKSRGQLPITADDIGSIAEVIEAPDARVYGAQTPRKQPILASIKRLPDGSVMVVEEVHVGRKTLALVSARKYPAARDFDSIAQTLLSNAQSDGGDGLIVIPQNSHPIYTVEATEIENPPSVLSRANPDKTGIHPQAGLSKTVRRAVESVNQASKVSGV